MTSAHRQQVERAFADLTQRGVFCLLLPADQYPGVGQSEAIELARHAYCEHAGIDESDYTRKDSRGEVLMLWVLNQDEALAEGKPVQIHHAGLGVFEAAQSILPTYGLALSWSGDPDEPFRLRAS